MERKGKADKCENIREIHKNVTHQNTQRISKNC